MSLFSAVILPKLEKEILAMEPQIASFLLGELKNLANEVIEWIEAKVHLDLNGDGAIGGNEEN